MVFLNEGLNAVKNLIAASVDKGQLGTGGTEPTENDTGLETADATTVLDVATTASADKSISFNYTLPSTGGTTTTYKEFVLRDSSNDVDFDRIVFTGISFTNNGTQNLIISKTWFFRNK